MAIMTTTRNRVAAQNSQDDGLYDARVPSQSGELETEAGTLEPPQLKKDLVVSTPEAAQQTPSALINDILTKLERRSDGLNDIRCKVRFVDDDMINISKRAKYGRILFHITEHNPRFLIHFDRTEVDGVMGKQEWYLFDGRWLYEVLERIKQVTKREVAGEGERVDLFDLETAPFPLPFGQKKDTILDNFNVTLAPLNPGDPPNTDHLVCTPKADSKMHRRYDKLEFFVLKDIHLPIRIIVTKSDGTEVSTADFPDLSAGSINAGVTNQDFEKPRAWKDYDEVVENKAAEDRR